MVFFVSFRIFFSDNMRVRILFFWRAKREFFFKNLTLGYMTKTLNQIIFFFLHQNQKKNFSNIGNQNIFLEKKHNPPPFKLNGRSLSLFTKTQAMNKYIVYVCLCFFLVVNFWGSFFLFFPFHFSDKLSDIMFLK
jgi:hypothetical protein